MVAIVSPYTHLAGHYATYTSHIAAAYQKATGVAANTFTSHRFNDRNMSTTPCAPWTRFFASRRYRGHHWGSSYDSLLRNIEFVSCLRRALREDTNTHIYCLDARHRTLFYYLGKSRHAFSTLCLGAPSPALMHDLFYHRAFSTNRLSFIVETEETRRQWEPVAGRHVVHIPAGIDKPAMTLESKAHARRRLGIPSDRLVCLFFGTHRQGKDYRTAIAAAHLSEAKPYLIFAGPLISRNSPARLLMDLRFDDAVVWDKHYRDGEEAPLFAACDAVVLPYAEGYTKGSAVLLQACKYERPVIATDTGYLGAFVREHNTGLLFQYGSAVSLAASYDAIQSWSNERNLADIRVAASMFSWDSLIKRYLSVFEPDKHPLPEFS